MADNLPTVDDVPQNLKSVGIEIPNDNILEAHKTHLGAASGFHSVERLWVETLFARDLDVTRAAIAVFNDLGDTHVKEITPDDAVHMTDAFVADMDGKPLTEEQYRRAYRNTVFNQLTDPDDRFNAQTISDVQAIIAMVDNMRYPLLTDDMRPSQHIESRFRHADDVSFSDPTLMVQMVDGDPHLTDNQRRRLDPAFQRDLQRMEMAQRAEVNGRYLPGAPYAYDAIIKADERYMNYVPYELPFEQRQPGVIEPQMPTDDDIKAIGHYANNLTMTPDQLWGLTLFDHDLDGVRAATALLASQGRGDLHRLVPDDICYANQTFLAQLSIVSGDEKAPITPERYEQAFERTMMVMYGHAGNEDQALNREDAHTVTDTARKLRSPLFNDLAHDAVVLPVTSDRMNMYSYARTHDDDRRVNLASMMTYTVYPPVNPFTSLPHDADVPLLVQRERQWRALADRAEANGLCDRSTMMDLMYDEDNRFVEADDQRGHNYMYDYMNATESCLVYGDDERFERDMALARSALIELNNSGRYHIDEISDDDAKDMKRQFDDAMKSVPYDSEHYEQAFRSTMTYHAIRHGMELTDSRTIETLDAWMCSVNMPPRSQPSDSLDAIDDFQSMDAKLKKAQAAALRSCNVADTQGFLQSKFNGPDSYRDLHTNDSGDFEM